jgi:predicted DCC family thiol-disulfide oxidoreductase YuxK
MNMLKAIDGFFFRRIDATAFGMMRAAWAFITLLYLFFQWPNVLYYYSEVGILPHWLEALQVRGSYRITILDVIDQPLSVFCLYLILCVLLFCMMVGLRTRIATIASVILLFSFHERNPMILGGGDTLLRTIGFILMIAPGIHAFSVDRAREQWIHWKKQKTLLPHVTMPIWPWRLLLWQLIVLYATSTWTKFLGTMWLDGTAIQTTLHHPGFARWDPSLMRFLIPLSSSTDYAALAWQAAWVLLLIPRWMTDLFFPRPIPQISLRRILIIGGIFFHGSIYLLLDAGVFSLAVFVAYIGLLRENDLIWLKNVFMEKSKKKGSNMNNIIVLYDGHCGLCLRSMFTLLQCDWLKKLKPVDFRIADDHRSFAPEVTERNLDKSMHIKLPNGSYLTGFDAFRYLSGKLPPLWPLYPLLWIPGVAPIGRRVYRWIADRRKRCNHESCTV